MYKYPGSLGRIAEGVEVLSTAAVDAQAKNPTLLCQVAHTLRILKKSICG